MTSDSLFASSLVSSALFRRIVIRSRLWAFCPSAWRLLGLRFAPQVTETTLFKLILPSLTWMNMSTSLFLVAFRLLVLLLQRDDAVFRDLTDLQCQLDVQRLAVLADLDRGLAAELEHLVGPRILDDEFAEERPQALLALLDLVQDAFAVHQPLGIAGNQRLDD